MREEAKLTTSDLQIHSAALVNNQIKYQSNNRIDEIHHKTRKKSPGAKQLIQYINIWDYP